MGPDFWRETPALFAELDEDQDVQAVVVYGSGDEFSFGLDLPGMMRELEPFLESRQPEKKDRIFRASLKTTRSGSEIGRKVDVLLIDGLLVNGSAKLVGWVSGIVRQVQTGYLYTYAFSMIIGLLLLLGWFIWFAPGA